MHETGISFESIEYNCQWFQETLRLTLSSLTEKFKHEFAVLTLNYFSFALLYNLEFCWQRVVNRTIWMIAILFFAIVVPAFGPVLSFVGGSFAALLGIILPVVFYARLEGYLPIWKEILFVFIILIALLGSVGNAYVEIKNIINVVFDRYHHS